MSNQQFLAAVHDMMLQSEERILKRLKAEMVTMVTKEELRQVGERLERKIATKDDLRQLGDRLERKMATKDDLKQLSDRLERKIASSHTANVKHHLETRHAVGTLNRRFDAFREGLARAAGPV